MYNSHDEIPAIYRRVILDETGLKRVSKVALEECNEIISDYIEFETTCESLRNYEILVSKDGKKAKYVFVEPDEALRKLDEIVGHFSKDRHVTAVLKQADRIVRAYVKGLWITPAPKDILLVNPTR